MSDNTQEGFLARFLKTDPVVFRGIIVSIVTLTTLFTGKEVLDGDDVNNLVVLLSAVPPLILGFLAKRVTVPQELVVASVEKNSGAVVAGPAYTGQIDVDESQPSDQTDVDDSNGTLENVESQARTTEKYVNTPDLASDEEFDVNSVEPVSTTELESYSKGE